MKLVLAKGVVVNGLPHRAGDVVETSKSDGELLLDWGAAKVYVEQVEPDLTKVQKRKPKADMV